MVKRVEFYWKDENFKSPPADGYKFSKGLVYGYLQKTIGEKTFNDLVFVVPESELKGIIISDIEEPAKDSLEK